MTLSARKPIMTKAKRKRLENAGWKIGGASQFLDLSADEAAIVELKLRLADAVKAERNLRKLTQHELARLLGSSQSRVAKLESADPSVSIDLMVRALLRMGASRRKLASYVAAPAAKQ